MNPGILTLSIVPKDESTETTYVNGAASESLVYAFNISINTTDSVTKWPAVHT